MRYDDRFLEELKSRLRLSDVIGRTVKLRRQGREWAGLSPFTKEKSPSFFVNDDKGFYHCFSSGKHGDLISFLQETERLSFPEAVERLAAEAGLALPAVDPEGAARDKQRQTLSDWLEEAAKWFEASLRRPAGREARAYLERRGLPEDQWARFRLGFAPGGRTGLKDHLIAKGARPGDLVEAGLLIAPEDGGAPYDRFRDRIIFPIADARGRVVSFGGRAMDPEAKAKYLNGPETGVFHKGRTVYGLAEARRLLAAGEADAPLVVVEGYMDVIACQRANIAAIAPMGTALTEEQMELLWRLHPEPTLCFDGDNAGRRAAARAIDRALPLLKPGKSFRFAVITGGKDPDDVLREHGPAALRGQLTHTTAFVEALFVRERDVEPLDTPERKTAFKVRLRTLAATIADKELSQAYREDLLGRYELLFPGARPVYDVGAAGRVLANRRWDKARGRGGAAAAGPPLQETKEAALRLSASARPLSAALALAALEQPAVVEDKIEVLAQRGFGDSQLDLIAQELVELHLEADHLEPAAVGRRLAARGLDAGRRKALEESARRSAAPFLDPGLKLDDVRALWSAAFDLLVRLEALERALVQAKEDLARDEDSSALMALKAERDLVRRAIETGAWVSGDLSAAVH